MAKLRPDKTSKSRKSKSSTLPTTLPPKQKTTPPSPTHLLANATSHLQTGQPELALPLAQRALATLSSSPPTSTLPALSLLATIHLELGDAESATKHFLQAVELDSDGRIPEDEGGGAEKFLWLAQLCDEGGEASVRWFERGVDVLRRELGTLEASKSESPLQARRTPPHQDGRELETLRPLIEDKQRKIGNALCGIVEVYMTDLSWHDDAEARCETHIACALLESPSDPAVLQTLASVRLSQSRLADARSALERSLRLWQDDDDAPDADPSHSTSPTSEPPNPNTPDFATRISLARLLMEAEMEHAALNVLERLILEDDRSVEAWYLGGWCLWLLAGKAADGAAEEEEEEEEEEKRACMVGSREWLREGLRLCGVLAYEDERLKAHAVELVAQLDGVLGEGMEGEDGWEGVTDEEGEEEEGGDQVMEDVSGGKTS